MKIPLFTPHQNADTGLGNLADGFTLIELMVAMAVFVLMAVMLVGMVDGTVQVTTQSDRRISGDAAALQVLDRISADIAKALVRDDLPFRVDKTAGNDAINFLANVDGYTAGRGMSVISFKCTSEGLQRGVEATSWTNGSEAMAFTSETNAAGTTEYLEVQPKNFDVIAKDVFRLEITFLMGDGTIKANIGTAANGISRVGSFSASSGKAPSDTIKAVIIGIASIGERARESLGPAGVTVLQSAFPDVSAGQKDSIQTWDGYSANSLVADVPLVRKSVRVYQRYLLINN